MRGFGLRETYFLQQKTILPNDSFFDLIYQGADIKELEHQVMQIAPLRQPLLEALHEQLIWGGLPELIQKNSVPEKLRYLRDYLQTYFEKDIRSLPTITDLDLYRKLLHIIAEQTGSLRQDERIKQVLGCARETLNKYRGYLIATMLYRELYPYIGATLRRITKAPKGYLTDNGLISYLTGISERPILEKSGQLGHRFENWFLQELQISLDREVKFNDIYYWRTSGGVEVDFVVTIAPKVFPFEVTCSHHIEARKVKNLRSFLSEHPEASCGFYVYLGDFHYDASTKICFLPAWAVG